jgi:hypothetical protein
MRTDRRRPAAFLALCAVFIALGSSRPAQQRGFYAAAAAFAVLALAAWWRGRPARAPGRPRP